MIRRVILRDVKLIRNSRNGQLNLNLPKKKINLDIDKVDVTIWGKRRR